MNKLKAAFLSLVMSCVSIHGIDNTVTIIDGTSTNIATFVDTGLNNLLLITNAGSATIDAIATESTAENNTVLVTGAGSVISNATTLSFAPSGISNTLQFVNGGRMEGAVAIGGSNNFLLFENTTNLSSRFNFNGTSNKALFKDSSITI